MEVHNCSLVIGGARLMHGPFSKILGGGGPLGSTPLVSGSSRKGRDSLSPQHSWWSTSCLAF